MKNTIQTPQEKRRAAYARLVSTLPVKQHTSINTQTAAKQKPSSGLFASV
jgi:hypothetical protein